MLRDRIKAYYLDQEKTCAESMLSAANEEYGLGLSPEDILLFKGFGGGMASGGPCGALTGGVAALSRLFGPDRDRDAMHELISGYVQAFETRLGHTCCSVLAEKYKKEDIRCYDLLLAAADLLEETVAREQGRESLPSAADVQRVKGLGCLQDKRCPNRFNVRTITRNGKLTAAEFRAVSEAAERFGTGEVAMTTRQTLEIQGVLYENIDALRAFLAEAGLTTGGTGAKVRPVVSCKGTTCRFGLIDTYDLSLKLHERYYLGWHGVALPHKFKIAVGGCPNNCVKPELNDVGIIGQRVPQVAEDICRGCKVCQVEKACPVKACGVENGKLVIDEAACLHCGRCLNACPFGAVSAAQQGYRVYLGGRWGKRTARGQALGHIFPSEEEVLSLVERILLLFRREGYAGERFADTVARLGFDRVEDMLLNGSFDREAILAAPLREKP